MTMVNILILNLCLDKEIVFFSPENTVLRDKFRVLNVFLLCSFFLLQGIHCYIQNDSYESLEAVVPGPKETPYEEIQFKIAMEFDSHYPFRPPSAKFITPVYHPNIDTGM